MARQIKSYLSYFPTAQVEVIRENDLLYEPLGVANADDAALVVSIKDFRVQEPLTLSKDSFLLSTHRRFAAAKYLQLETVPVRFKDVIFAVLRDAIESGIDVAEFHAQIDLEREDAGIVKAYRRTVFEAIGGSLDG